MAESSIKEKRARRRKRKRDARNENPEAADETADKSITAKKGYATPSRRKGEVGVQERKPNPIVGFFRGIIEYLDGVRSELEKVTWPTREETQRLSYIVAIVTLISALVLGGLSILFTEIFNLGVDQPLIFIGVFVVFVALLYAYSQYVSRQTTEY